MSGVDNLAELQCRGCGQLRNWCTCTMPPAPAGWWSSGSGVSTTVDNGQGKPFLDRIRSALLDTTGLDTIPVPESLVDGVLYRDSLAWLQGKPGEGKSFVALDLAGCVGTGEQWQLRRTVRGDVLFIVAEGVSGMRQRVRAWEKAMGRAMTGVRWLPMPVQAGSEEQWPALIELARDLRPALIVIDTQARVTVGMEENAARDMGVFVDRLEDLRRACGACVLVVHHMGRTGDHMRGSTALEGAATTLVKVAKDEDHLTLSCPKQKDGEQFDDIDLRLVPTGDSAVLMPTDGAHRGGSTAAAKMAGRWWQSHGADRVSVTKLVKSEVGSERTLYRHLRALIAEGLAEKIDFGGHSYYRLTREPS